MVRALASFLITIVVLGPAFVSDATAARPHADINAIKPETTKKSTQWVRLPSDQEPDTGNEHRYIVQFDDEPLPLYEGGVIGLSPANLVGGKLNTSSAAARAYVAHLQQRQTDMVNNMTARAGSITVERAHQHALNAVTVRMTETAANKVRHLPGVRLVERDRAVQLNTATSVPFIGTGQVWDGSATGGLPYQGEGMVVGIIDSGINHSHPSFADVGADGYDHTNPLGSGVYLGECATIPGLCNDKLIGAYTFLAAQSSVPPDEILIPGDPPSTDTDGHGSHVASTAAGNILANIALPDADGNPGSIVFSQLSGVAPHSNVVAFKVCAPSCFFSDIVAAVDQAIADGVVDVLNHSIGTPAGSPWNSSQAQAFLAARAAGIFVANSAGNSGPDAGTAEAAGNAPWIAGVAATTHDRAFPTKLLANMSGGTAPPADIVGRSVSGSITGDIVYAADFPTSNGSANDTQPEQCLDPFPPGTFTANQIVLCDRGAIARVAKGQNVRDGGAGGFILGNVAGAATDVGDDPHVVPAIHVGSADADALRAWLATGSGHTGTITAVDSTIADPAAGDIVGDFSSRGPYTGFDILGPNTAAPGVNILAAGAELTDAQVDLIGQLYVGTPSEFPSVPGPFGQIGGTSMASPHIAGTAALIKQAHPAWTDAEVLSAIMTTGTYDLLKEDGVTPADAHDIGGGRVQVAEAINAALVLDETAANFEAADPALGGEPSTLNVAGLVQDECVLTCTWSRTVRATVDGSWTAAGFDSWVSVSPASFSLSAGQTQVIDITVDASALPADAWSFSRAVLTPAAAATPATQLPIAVVPAFGQLPDSVDILATRGAGSQLIKDVTASVVDGFNVKIFELAKVEGMSYALAGDSDNSSPYDDLSDGVAVVLHDAPAGTQRVRFEVLSSESPDLDLFVGVVLGGNPIFDPGFEICVSATASAFESCDLDAEFLQLLRDIIGTDDLSFYAVVQNWAPSAPAAVDTFEFAATNVSNKMANRISAEGPAGTLPPLEPFDVRFFWNLPSSKTGDRYLSATEWYGDASQSTLLGKVPLQLFRGPDDVTVTSNVTGPVNVGDPLTLSAVVQPNFTLEDRTYEIAVLVPSGLDIDPASITDGGVLRGRKITWNVIQESLIGKEGAYNVSTNADDLSCDTPFGGYVNLADFGIGPDAGLVGDSFTATAFGGQNPIDFYGQLRTGGITFTDDGFGFFESTSGPLPFINLPIPNPGDPNDMLAPFWFDWIVEYDGERGITLANAGPDISIIEWDGVEPWTPDGSAPPLADFQLFMWMPVDPSGPEFIFAFDNLDPGLVGALAGDPSLVTTGVENRTGTAGTEYTGDYFDNLIVCFDYEGPNTSPRALSFTATPRTFTSGHSIKVNEFDRVDNPGSRLASSSTKVEVNPLPYTFDGFYGLRDGKKIDLDRRKVKVEFRLYDPVVWWWPVYDADATVEVTDSGGNVVASGDADFTWRGWRYEFTWQIKGLAPGNYTITASLDDGTSHSVTVELVDD